MAKSSSVLTRRMIARGTCLGGDGAAQGDCEFEEFAVVEPQGGEGGGNSGQGAGLPVRIGVNQIDDEVECISVGDVDLGLGMFAQVGAAVLAIGYAEGPPPAEHFSPGWAVRDQGLPAVRTERKNAQVPDGAVMGRRPQGQGRQAPTVDLSVCRANRRAEEAHERVGASRNIDAGMASRRDFVRRRAEERGDLRGPVDVGRRDRVGDERVDAGDLQGRGDAIDAVLGDVAREETDQGLPGDWGVAERQPSACVVRGREAGEDFVAPAQAPPPCLMILRSRAPRRHGS